MASTDPMTDLGPTGPVLIVLRPDQFEQGNPPSTNKSPQKTVKQEEFFAVLVNSDDRFFENEKLEINKFG